MLNNIISDSEKERMFDSVIKASFPNLNNEHQKLLHRYLVALIEYIAICFNFRKDANSFRTKLSQNSYKDCRWILTYLLPYINTNVKSYDDLTDLGELYSLRTDDDVPETVKRAIQSEGKFDYTKMDAMNFVSPKYVFSNLQYGRFDRSGSFYEPVKFDPSHIEQNYYLLLDTIKSVRNKLHINWIDIVPFRLDNYEESELFENTQKKFDNKTLADWDPIDDYGIGESDLIEFGEKAQGLDVADIYNTLSMDLYQSIVQYKWLIFDTIVDKFGFDRVMPVFQLLNKVFDVPKMLTGERFIELSEEKRDLFTERFNILRQRYASGESLAVVNESTDADSATAMMTIKSGALGIMMNGFVMFYDQKYSKIYGKEGDKSGYVELPKEIKEDDVDKYDQDKAYDNAVINLTLQSISVDTAYDFIVDAILGFKSTWYGYRMLNESRTEGKAIDDVEMIEYNYHYEDKNNQGIVITHKHIYNFAKSAVHVSKNRGAGNVEYIRLPMLWSGLSDSAKSVFIRKITDQYPDYKTWFNISRNIMRVMQSDNPSFNDRGAVIEVMGDLYEKIQKDIVKIVFESLITRGTLTMVVANNDFTNNALYDMSKDQDKNKLVSDIANKYMNNDYMKHSFYYLTNTPFSEVGPFETEIGGVVDRWTYQMVNSNPASAWYLATAFNWVAQLGFCHKFVHNRVNYITGATGAGKSTQIPKMYTYFLKAVDRVDDGTVVVTVPRTNVATGVSSWISREMSLPYDNAVKDKKTRVKYENYVVQFKHRGERHMRNGQFPKVRFVTDGSVINDVLDPLMRSKRTTRDNKSYIYGRDQTAHVLIVDEAHEHNMNMDLILSMSKNVAMYNNRFRLVVMSATMDDDEPTYRRFYRDVNDNRKYPPNQWIAKHKLDRIYTERRFHISPPDVGTRYKIDEHYRPGGDPVQIVREIVNNTSSGEILVFQPGTAEISATVQALNDALPHNVIAIPYHAKLPSEKQSIMPEIHKELPKIRFNRNDNFATANIYSGDNRYDRAVIVSTNISEASITYKSMVYVVETGVEKTAKFDYKTRTVILKANSITEASRLQRKGRVGRTAPGVVYYTYSEGQLVPNKKQYNISVQDSHLSIYLALLRDQSDLPIFTPFATMVMTGDLDRIARSDDALQSLYRGGTLDGYRVMKALEKSYTDSNVYDKKFIESIVDLIMEMYVPDDNYYGYIGDEFARVNGAHSSYPYPVYFSGFDPTQLTDTQGKFYIVHPDELSFDRNINGDPVSADNDVVTLRTKKPVPNPNRPAFLQQTMRSNKAKAFWSTLIDAKMCGIKGGRITKLPYGSIVEYGMSKLIDIENPYYAKAMIIAYGMCDSKRFDHVLDMLCYLAVTEGKATSMFKADDVLLAHYAMLTKKRGEDMTPSKRDIIRRSKSVFGMDITNTDRESYVDSDYRVVSNVVRAINALEHRVIKQSVGSYEQSWLRYNDLDDDNVITKLIVGDESVISGDEDNLLFRDKLLDNILELYSNHQQSVLLGSDNDISILQHAGLVFSTLVDFIKLRNRVKKSFSDMIQNVDGFLRRSAEFKTIDDIKHVMKSVVDESSATDLEAFRKIMLLTYPYSIVRKVEGSPLHYVSVYGPSLDSMYTIQSASRNYYYPDTYADQKCLQEYVHYTTSDTESWAISGLMRITVDDMRLLSDVYSITSSKEYDVDVSRDAVTKYVNERHSRRYPNGNDRGDRMESSARDAINGVSRTVDRIKGDLRTFGPYSGVVLDDAIFE